MATAMVWGASGGIGSALVHELVDRGWSVIAFARSDIDTEHTSVTYKPTSKIRTVFALPCFRRAS